MPAIAIVGGWLGDRLVVGSIQGIVLVALAWLVCRRRMRLSAAMQTALWWAVLLKLVLVFAPLPSLPIPILPAAAAPLPVIATSSTADVTPARPPAADRAIRDDGQRWVLPAVGIWLLGLCWHGAQMLRPLRTTRAMVRRSVSFADDDELLRWLATSIGLRALPEVRIAEEASAPLVVGAWRPTVLMPAMASLSPDERRMALGHEFMHVKRRDLALAWIPAVAERLFFFHPLVRLAVREYVTAREAACDAAVVRALDVAPDDYGQLLVRFGVAGHRLAWSAGGASGSGAVLRRRLDMLQHLSSHSRRSAWLVAALIAVAIVPSHLVARTAVTPATPPLMVAADVTLPPVLQPQQSAAAPAPQRQAEPHAAPEPAPQPVPETVGTADFLRDQIKALERQLRAAEGAAAGSQSEQYAQAQREYEKLQSDYEKQLQLKANEADAQAERAGQRRRQLDEINLARELERAQRLDADKQQELAKRYQEMADRMQQELQKVGAAKRDQDVATTRQDYLKQRLEDLSRRMRELADLQQRLQMEAEQLKIELNAR